MTNIYATRPIKPVRWTEYEATGTYHYHGRELASGWQIQRVTVANPVEHLVATEANNDTIDNLASAWSDRASLTYA
jgi:hypothetical protein